MNFWTEDRRKKAVELADQGMSRSQIAAQIGDGCTRNAVIGILLRMGYEASATTVHKVRVARQVAKDMGLLPKPVRKARPKPKPEPKQPEVPKLPAERCFEAGNRQTVPIWNLRNDACKWPFNPVEGELTTYCGEPAKAGESFCPAHVRLAYNPEGRKRYEKMQVLRGRKANHRFLPDG